MTRQEFDTLAESAATTLGLLGVALDYNLMPLDILRPLIDEQRKIGRVLADHPEHHHPARGKAS